MADLNPFRVQWRKSTRSGGGNCVEVTDGLPPAVAVRDSRAPAAPALAFARGQWDAFTARVKSGSTGIG